MQTTKQIVNDKIRIFAILLITKLKETNNEEAIDIIIKTLNEIKNKKSE